jgi:hypothetical protein
MNMEGGGSVELNCPLLSVPDPAKSAVDLFLDKFIISEADLLRLTFFFVLVSLLLVDESSSFTGKFPDTAAPMIFEAREALVRTSSIIFAIFSF